MGKSPQTLVIFLQVFPFDFLLPALPSGLDIIWYLTEPSCSGFLLNLNSNDLFSNPVLLIILKYPNHCSHFSSNSINIFWIPTSSLKMFLTDLFFPLYI